MFGEAKKAGGFVKSMKRRTNSGAQQRTALLAAGLLILLALRLFVAGFTHPQLNRPRPQAIRVERPISVSSTPAARINRLEVKNYFLDFAGDHSLNAAIVIERATAGHADYTVRLRLASGTEQSVTVAGPPGGLKVEMRDMTGDHVPNDVVLHPAMLNWPPTVLVNDGHDHFAVAASGQDPGNFLSHENLESRSSDGSLFALMGYSGFKTISLPDCNRLPAPESQQSALVRSDRLLDTRMEHASSSGRAPPFVVLI